MPDLNSLPPSNPSSTLPSPSLGMQPPTVSHQPSSASASTQPPSTASPPVLQRLPSDHRGRVSPRFERRRSDLFHPNSSSAGVNAGLPSSAFDLSARHHSRQPSLGELHQELENEQEAQVNRLLAQIRAQQAQLATYERTSQSRSSSISNANGPNVAAAAAAAGSAASTTANGTTTHAQPLTSHPPQVIDRSRTPSASRHPFTSSPVLRSHSPAVSGTPSAVSRQSSFARRVRGESNAFVTVGESASEGRDEVSLAQAETANLMRENAMLKARVRELEGEIRGMRVTGGAVGAAEASVNAAPS